MRAVPLRAARVGVEARTAPKHDAIMAAAGCVFQREGYSASMDLVAAEAGVSKQTVYNHFGSKEELFRAIVEDLSSEFLDVLAQAEGAPGDPAAALRTIGLRLLDRVLAPSSLALHRMLVAEAPRFPDLAREIYVSGPMRAVSQLARYLAEENRRGTLAVADPALAAEQFIGAVIGNLQLRLLLDPDAVPDEAEVERAVGHAVRGFLRSHAPTQAHPVSRAP